MLKRNILAGALVGLALTLPTKAATGEGGYEWESAFKVEAKDTTYMIQINRKAFAREGGKLRYWVRLMHVKMWGDFPMLEPNPAFGPSLYESDCANTKWRIVQGTIIYGYDGPSVPLSRPAEWEFIPPDSIPMAIHQYVCKQD